MSANNATQSCILDNDMPPPGICSPVQHKELEEIKDSKCGGKRTCKGINDCATIFLNIKKNIDCALARENLMVTCFPPMGNQGHRIAVNDAINAAVYCEKKYNEECKPDDEPVPVPTPQPAPVEDKGFMEKISKLTGLTGTALIIYVIISETSRLFPPRNFLPAP